MDHLKPEELKNSMDLLLTVLQCPVCLVLVEKDMVLCVNGHATCKKCRGNQQNSTCPTCRSAFSNLQQNTVFSQILEAVPHRCRFDKCDHVVKSGEDHEIYCRYRTTQCRFGDCKWLGSVDNLPFHLEDKHPQEKVYSGTKVLVKVSKCFVDSSGTLLVSACGHYFWQKIVDDYKDNYKIIYIPLWVGKPTRDLYMRVWFQAEGKEFDAGMKLKLNETDNTNNCCSFAFGKSVFTTFFTENELKYYLMITEGRDESINMLLE